MLFLMQGSRIGVRVKENERGRERLNPNRERFNGGNGIPRSLAPPYQDFPSAIWVIDTRKGVFHLSGLPLPFYGKPLPFSDAALIDVSGHAIF